MKHSSSRNTARSKLPAGVLCALLLLGGCSNPAVSQEPAPEQTSVTADTAPEGADAAHAALTGFLDACMAGDLSGVMQWSDSHGILEESVGRGNTSHAADAALAEELSGIALTSYSVESVRQANMMIAQQCAEKAYALRAEVQQYEAGGAGGILMYPEHLTAAAELLDTVTDGYLFEITADSGIGVVTTGVWHSGHSAILSCSFTPQWIQYILVLLL